MKLSKSTQLLTYQFYICIVSLPLPSNVLNDRNYHATADRLGLSVRDRTMLLGSVYSVAGINLDNVTLSTTSAFEAARSSRQSISDEIKQNFVPPKRCTVHFDTKKVNDSCAKDTNKVERLVVSVAGSPNHVEGKLLGAPVIKSKAESGVRMGRSEAIAVNKLCDEWKVSEDICGMVFDTTATNTGNQNGGCTIYEAELMKRKLLWLACRHHVDEVVLSDVWKELFGSSTSPDNELFKQFRDNVWYHIDTTLEAKQLDCKRGLLRSRRDMVIPFYTELLKTKNRQQLPRDDYKECAQLMLQILGVSPPQGIHWYRPGATHNARWMVTVLYSAKMFAFSDQINLEDGLLEKFERLIVFCALYYVPVWLTSSLGRDAPVNDLNFWKALIKFKSYDEDIACVAIAALERHMWYLTEELSPLSIFSNKISDQEKSLIAKQIIKCKSEYIAEQSMGQPTFPTVTVNTKLKDLIGPKSWLLFSLFKDVSWLKTSAKNWNKDKKYTEMKDFISQLKVVNDLAERGVKLMSDYSTIVTNNEEQKQCLLQTVEDHRKKYPDFMKKTMKLM